MLELNQIICGDNVKIMQGFPDNIIDLTVTSPPYDNIQEYEEGHLFDFKAVARELYRTTKPGGQLVWIVADQTKDYDESGTSFRQALFFKEIGFKLNDTMIYHRLARPGRFPRYSQEFEYMFILCKGVPTRLNFLKDRIKAYAKKTMERANRRESDGTIIKHPYTVSPEKKRGNVWKYHVGSTHTTKDRFAWAHPAMFPEKLASDHIESWSNEGDLVLDPFCGSGTTLKMAKLLNRNYIGIDISEKYCNLSHKRVQQQRLEELT